MLGFEPQPLDHEASVLTIILSLQVRLKGVKVCAQQSIPIICKVAICTEFANLEKGLIGTIIQAQ